MSHHLKRQYIYSYGTKGLGAGVATERNVSKRSRPFQPVS